MRENGIERYKMSLPAFVRLSRAGDFIILAAAAATVLLE
jgi:hypothetical protein